MVVRSKMVLAVCIAASALLLLKIFTIQFDEKVISASLGRGRYVISEIKEYAGIYDCNGKRLNNRTEVYRAVINPNDESAVKAFPYVVDYDVYENGLKGNLPFLCTVSEDEIDGVPVILKKTQRTDNNQLARHIIGYTSDGNGVCGLEYAYNKFLHSSYSENKAEYSVNAVGSVLSGLYSEVNEGEKINAGIVTALDYDIQQICENAMNNCEAGAAIVMDIKSGEIKACASRPLYNQENPAENLDDENSPFVNKAFSAYSVGSIFKLVTAAAALEQGISPEFSYVCRGVTDVEGQEFSCHKWGGHGEINMYEAVEYSCNPYFIELSKYIDSDFYIKTAKELGFGEEINFCRGITSDSGYIPTEREISIPAEKANISFGQGKLTATPLQICRMTAAIANNGMMSYPKLVLGLKNEDGTYEKYTYPKNERVMSYLTAQKLKECMYAAANSENSYSKSSIVISGGKTSTAQTGRYNSDFTEKMNCWFTGYFPAEAPKYAVTVMVENGVSGNVSAAPIYIKIAEGITKVESMK